MSKIIKLTQDYLEAMRDEIIESLSKARMTDGKFTFTKSFDKVDKRATLLFTEVAWIKMWTIIFGIDKEIAWHGVVKRDEDNTYVVSDILVYPQKVTGATVESDDDKYPFWYAKLTDTPEVFDNLRMQGHSHVNMGVTPSGTDLAFYKDILDMVGEDDFYVFVIFNKKGEKTVKIYDFRDNLLYETADVDVKVSDNGTGLSQVSQDIKDMVAPAVTTKETTASTWKSSSPGYGNGNYGGYSGYSGYSSGYTSEYSTAKYNYGNYGKALNKDKDKGESKKSSGRPKYYANFWYDEDDDF